MQQRSSGSASSVHSEEAASALALEGLSAGCAEAMESSLEIGVARPNICRQSEDGTCYPKITLLLIIKH